MIFYYSFDDTICDILSNRNPAPAWSILFTIFKVANATLAWSITYHVSFKEANVTTFIFCEKSANHWEISNNYSDVN